MIVRRLFEKRGAAINGSVGWSDPAAIPPNSAVQRAVAGTVVNEHSVLNLVTTYRCVELIADFVAGLPLNAYRTMNGQTTPLSPSPSLIANPFADLSTHQGMVTSAAGLALLGNCFWLITSRDYLGNPTSLEILNPPRVRVVMHQGVKSYQLNGTSWLNPEDVIHITRLTLPGGLRGLNPIEYAAQTMGIGLAAEELAARMYSQGVMPSGVLTSEKPLDKEQAKRLAEQLSISHGGLAQSHLPLVLDNGLKFQPLMIDPSTMQLLDARLFTANIIAQLFGVPPDMLGLEDHATLKDVESRLAYFTVNTLSAYLHRFEEAFTNALPRGNFVRYDTRELMKTTALARAQRATAMRTAGVLTPNELRADEGLPPIDSEFADALGAPLNSNQNGSLTLDGSDADDPNNGADT